MLKMFCKQFIAEYSFRVLRKLIYALSFVKEEKEDAVNELFFWLKAKYPDIWSRLVMEETNLEYCQTQEWELEDGS